jgi:hypothetical protein
MNEPTALHLLSIFCQEKQPMSINWNDPAERLGLIERVGSREYNRLFAEHVQTTTVSIVNGYGIRPVGSRFGRIYMVMGTRQGYATLPQAEAYARTLPMRR